MSKKTEPAATVVASQSSSVETIVAPSQTFASATGESEILSIPMSKIDLAPEKYQPRPFDPTSEDFRQKKDFAAVNDKWLNLVIVSRAPGGRFTLWDGRHRFEASKSNDWKSIEARVFKSLEPSRGLIMGLMGNIQSKQMTKQEIAAAVAVYLQTSKGAIQDVAADMNVTPNTIRNYLSLNNVIAEGQKLISEGKIKAASAYALASIPSELQKDWLEQAQESKTGKFIKAAQEFVKKLRADPTPATRKSSKEAASRVSQAAKVLGQTELEALLAEAKKADQEVFAGEINDAYQAGLIDAFLLSLGRKPNASAASRTGYALKTAKPIK